MPNQFDSANYPTVEPLVLVAGDRWAWKRTDLGLDYAPASYALKYTAQLEGDGTDEFDITTSESGTDYIVEVAAATTVGYTAGVYHWQCYIVRSSDSERITVDRGTFEVLADWDTATTDPRSHARIVLEAIEAVIESRATKDQENYAIGGRSLSRTPVKDLLLLRDRYKAEYAQEQRAEAVADGRGHSGKIKVRL